MRQCIRQEFRIAVFDIVMHAVRDVRERAQHEGQHLADEAEDVAEQAQHMERDDTQQPPDAATSGHDNARDEVLRQRFAFTMQRGVLGNRQPA